MDPRETSQTLTRDPGSRRTLWLALLALTGLGLAAWLGWHQMRKEAARPDLTGPITARSLNGTWAWSGIENCKNFYRTITFAGDRIYVRDEGKAVRDLLDAKLEKMDIGTAPTVAVLYTLGDNKYESQYRFESINEIVLIDDLVNGVANPAIDKARGKKLVRCAQTDPMPDPAAEGEAQE